jgi:hypothetical protein
LAFTRASASVGLNRLPFGITVGVLSLPTPHRRPTVGVAEMWNDWTSTAYSPGSRLKTSHFSLAAWMPSWSTATVPSRVRREPSLLLRQSLYSAASVTLSVPVKRRANGAFRLVGRATALSRLPTMKSDLGAPAAERSGIFVSAAVAAKLSASRPLTSTRPLRFGGVLGSVGSVGSAGFGGLVEAIFLTTFGPMPGEWVLVASTPFGLGAVLLPLSLLPPPLEPGLDWPAS